MAGKRRVHSERSFGPPKQWYVERAALEPGRRSASLRAALGALLAEVPAAGAALIHTSADDVKLWAVEYAGSRETEMRRWISARIDGTLESIAHALTERAPCSPASPMVIALGVRSSGPGGLWIVWPRGTGDGPDLGNYRAALDEFRAALEEFVEVEHREDLYFRGGEKGLNADLAKALRDGDEGALSALLTFGRMVGDADFAYWGAVHDDVVDVGWHQGARDSGFGFELPLGQGVGGRAFAAGEILDIPDYRNCQYRYPGVSDVTDREDVRSTLAIPVRSDYSGTGAVLYAARRSVEPFTPAQRILLSRLARSIEPVPVLLPSSRWFFATGAGGLKSARSELRGILLRSHDPQDVEKWLERLARGTAILTDGGGRPYVLANAERLERLQSMQDGRRGPRVVPLGDEESSGRGHLNLWPSVDLPLDEWPDLLEDAAAVSNVVIDRREHAHDRLNKQRSYWLREVKASAGGGNAAHLRREGNRLGLAVDRGEVWAFAWSPDGTTEKEQARPKMISEDAVLDLLGSPPIFVDDNVGVLLLEETRVRPSEVRDGLLRHLAPSPLWLVHGAVYDSIEALGEALSRTMDAVERMRREEDERFVVEIGDHGLDGLIENPKLREELAAFAGNLLEPLLTYDAETGSCLTETFCRALTSGSAEEAAKSLFVHANTVRYRLRRAGEILGKDLSAPKERTALILAAFVWLRGREPAMKPDA